MWLARDRKAHPTRARALPPLAPLLATALLATAFTHPAPAAAAPQIGLAVEPPAFSPNGDGALDLATAIVTSDVAGSLTLELLGANDAVVRTLASDEAIAVGETRIEWDGIGDAEEVVADGAYTVRGTVTDATGSTTAEAQVVVDTRPPRVRWRRIAPDPVERVHARVRFVFRVSEAAAGRLVVTDALGDVVHVRTWDATAGAVRLEWNLRSPAGRRVPPGGFVASVLAHDEAGNDAGERERAFRDVHPVEARVVTGVRGAGRRVALTFDDCVFEGAWGRILRVLERRHALASFFCPGQRVLAEPGLARRTVRGGHAVGSHGWDHADLAHLGRAAIDDRLRRDEAAWWRTSGATAVPLFRPPYGSLDAEVRRAAGATGYAWVALWDVDPRDWERPGVGVIVDRVLSGIHAGSIVVLHVNPQTAQALPRILDGLARRRLEPVTMLELLERADGFETALVARRPV